MPMLTPLMQLVEEMGLEVTYAYDNLVFIEHNAFLFQFSKSTSLALYFNTDCPAEDMKSLEKKICSLGKNKKLSILRKGRFSMKQRENEENIDLAFFDDD